MVNGRYTSSNLDYEKKLLVNDHGSITGYGGVQHHVDGDRPEAHAGVRGIFEFGGQGRPKSDDERLFDIIMEKHRSHCSH